MSETRAEVFEHQLICYCDFLGFSDAVQDKQRMNAMLQSLSALSALRGEYAIKRQFIGNGMIGTSVRPAITTFSDNVVISYTMTRENIASAYNWHALVDLRAQVGTIAKIAFDAGLLIRGGIAVGSLFHRNGMVLGEALVKAYELESKVAIYPRIIIPPSLVGPLDERERRDCSVATSEDGLFEFDYFSAWRDAAIGGRVITLDKGPAWQQRNPDRTVFNHDHETNWLRDVSATTAKKIKELNDADRLGAAAKWSWFQAQLSQRLKPWDQGPKA